MTGRENLDTASWSPSECESSSETSNNGVPKPISAGEWLLATAQGHPHPLSQQPPTSGASALLPPQHPSSAYNYYGAFPHFGRGAGGEASKYRPGLPNSLPQQYFMPPGGWSSVPPGPESVATTCTTSLSRGSSRDDLTSLMDGRIFEHEERFRVDRRKLELLMLGEFIEIY